MATTVDRFRKIVNPAEVRRSKARLIKTVVRSEEKMLKYRIAAVKDRSVNGVNMVAKLPLATCWTNDASAKAIIPAVIK